MAMAKAIVAAMVMSVLVAAGCSMNNRSIARDRWIELPHGEAIVGTVTHVKGPFVHKQEGAQQLIWERPGQPDKVLAVAPASGKVDYDACRTAQVRLSPDGNRAWLTKDGKVLASFDRQSGAAWYGEHAQPDWATP